MNYPDFNTAASNPMEWANQKAMLQQVAWSVQGQRIPVASGVNPGVTINLNVPGMQLLGIALTSLQTNASDILQTLVTLTINTKNVLTTVSAPLMCGAYQQGMPFMPVPYPLNGNDNINITFNKQDANATVIFVNLFYLPQQQFR